MKNENRAYVELANRLVEEFYKKQSAGLLSNLNKRNMDELEVSREKIIKTIRSELSEYESDSGAAITEEEKDIIMEIIDRELWGYGVIDPYIHEEDISDIKIYGGDRVMAKEVGKRKKLDVRFESDKAYKKFVSKLLERNKINLGTANAIQTFTDTSLDDFILRITVISGLLTDSGLPVVAIRKIPKNKYNLLTLSHKGMDDTSRNGEAHYGMGLFFAKTVAEKYGGGIKLSNSENTGGARVEIFFLSSQETS